MMNCVLECVDPWPMWVFPFQGMVLTFDFKTSKDVSVGGFDVVALQLSLHPIFCKVRCLFSGFVPCALLKIRRVTEGL